MTMQDPPSADPQIPATKRPVPLPLRNDTFLGVCEGLGEELGFNPLLLRVGLSAGLLWNPAAIVGIYLGLGLLLAISRYAFPAPKAAAVVAAAPAEPRLSESQDVERERELIAA